MRFLAHLLFGPLRERRIARVRLFLQFLCSPLAERETFALVRHFTGLLSCPLLEEHAMAARVHLYASNKKHHFGSVNTSSQIRS